VQLSRHPAKPLDGGSGRSNEDPAPSSPHDAPNRSGDQSGGAQIGRYQPLTVTEHGTVFNVAGELDLATAPILEDRLADVSGSVRLDLQAMTFIDSAGIAVLVRLSARCKSDGGVLRVENCCPQVERTLRIVGVYEMLTEGQI